MRKEKKELKEFSWRILDYLPPYPETIDRKAFELAYEDWYKSLRRIPVYGVIVLTEQNKEVLIGIPIDNQRQSVHPPFVLF